MTGARSPSIIAPADPESSFPLNVSFWALVTHQVTQAALPPLPLADWECDQRGERGWEAQQPPCL